MMWWFDSNKTKPNKTKNQAPSFFANLGLNIEGLCSFHCGIVRRNVRVFFFFFNLFFVFFFFLKRFRKMRETGSPEVSLYFGEGLRRSLGNAAGCEGGRGQMCTELCRLVLCMDVLCRNPPRSHLLMCKNFPDKP